MDDLFYREQEILEQAQAYAKLAKDEQPCELEVFAQLVKEYGRLLKLVRRVTRVSDKTAVELNDAKIMLMDKVQYDALTKIYNREFFDVGFKQAILDCMEKNEPLGILMMDVDFFKLYNDTYGHGAGDECLQRIAKKLEATLSDDSRFVARYGGEEFIAVLPNVDETDIRKIGERVLHNIRDLQIPHEKNTTQGYVTISVGGVSIDKVQELCKGEYVSCADEALYHSKQRGRDCFTLHFFKGNKNNSGKFAK